MPAPCSIAASRRRRRREAGFSLIELMIVLLIIAILLAVAIPTYLSASDRAENRAAQELLGNAVQAGTVAMQGSVSPWGPSTSVEAAQLLAGVGAGVKLLWATAPETAAGQVSFYYWSGPNPLVLLLRTWSPTGVCWGAFVQPDGNPSPPSGEPGTPGTWYSVGSSPTPAGCNSGTPDGGWYSTLAATAKRSGVAGA